jgi:AraC-binding-like domain
MAAVKSSKPLDNFPLVHSRSIEEVRETVARVYAKPTLVPAHGVTELNAAINRCRLPHTALAFSGYGVAVEIDYPATNIFSLLVPVRGAGEISCGRIATVLPAGGSAVRSAGISHRSIYSADYEHLILQIDAAVLTSKLSAMIGTQIGEPLQITPQANAKHPAAQMLAQYIPLLAGTLNAADPPFPAWWIEQTEQLLMTLLLFGYRHNYSHLIEQDAPDAAPWQVRRAEEFIEANADRAVSLEELAELTGVSAFSLFGSFRKYRGYSPLAFHAQVRSKRGRGSR